jgi:hypothetical protein
VWFSSVDIVTRYVLGSPWIELLWGGNITMLKLMEVRKQKCHLKYFLKGIKIET